MFLIIAMQSPLKHCIESKGFSGIFVSFSSMATSSRNGKRRRAHPFSASVTVLSFLLICDAFSTTTPVVQIERRTAALRNAPLYAVYEKEKVDDTKRSVRPFKKGFSAGPIYDVNQKGNVAATKRSVQLNEKASAAGPDYENEIFGLPRDSVAAPLTLLLVSQLILFVGVGAVIPSIPLYGKEIGLSASANGIVISAPAVALLLLANGAGQFADKARRPAMIGGMALIAVSDVGTAFATGLPALVAARLGLGAGRSVAESGERGMLADLAGRVPELRGKILAAQQATVALGIAIGAPLGGLVVEQYGPRASFLCVSAAAVVALTMYLFLPETVAGTDDEAYATSKKSDNHDDESAGDWKKLLQDNRWKGLALCQCGASFGFAAKIATIPVLAADILPGGAIGAGALLSAAGLSGLVGAPVGGWLTDKTGARTTAILAGITSAIGLALIPFALSPWSSVLLGDSALFETNGVELGGQAAAFSALVILWSIGASAQGPALTAVAQELAPLGAEAKSLALPRAAGDGTYIVAPFTLGLVADKYSAVSPGVECAAAGAMMLVGVTALTFLGGTSNDSKDIS